MALTPAEKQRNYRERRKKNEVKASLAITKVFSSPFCEYFEPYRFGSDFDLTLTIAGIETPVFKDDLGALEHTSYPDPDTLASDALVNKAKNSLGRAELIVEHLAHAAADLAGWINSYKRSEIKLRLQEIEERDLSDPNERKAALQEATRLNKMLDQLGKQVRWTFPQWKVTGS